MTGIADRRPLGRTGLNVTPVCIGTSPLASMPRLYGYEVEGARAVATVRAVLESPINYLDTSNGYGAHGEAELRVGEALAEAGGPPDGFVIATKVDPDRTTADFSGDRVRRSAEESLERLGLDQFQLLHLHDPERIGFAEATRTGGAVEALVRLKEEGITQNIGVAGGSLDVLRSLVELDVFDAVLNHNRFTLVDQTASPLFDAAVERGMGVMNAAPYGGGILARGPAAQCKYAYGEHSDLIESIAAMQAACAAHGVPLAAAALQFSLREPRVSSTVVGVSAPERVAETLSLAEWSIPDELWAELALLAPAGGAGLA